MPLMKLHRIKSGDVNSTDNDTISDVVGNREDKSFSNVLGSGSAPSVIGHLRAGYFHIHSKAQVYPRLADAVSINNEATGVAAGDWTEGDKQVIVPENAITSAFDIHWVKIFTVSDNTEYVLSLYNGETLIGEVGFARSAPFSAQSDEPIQIPPQPANSEITATLAAKSGAATRTVTMKVYYHTYPDIT